MIFTRMLSNRQMAAMCRRMAISSESGIDIRRIIAREAEHAPAGMRAAFDAIRDDVESGESLHESVQAQAAHFPRLFVDLVEIGEVSGGLPDVLIRLAEHYEFKVRLGRIFLAAIAWPMIQLTFVLVLIGAVIGFSGTIAAASNGGQTDMFGLGLSGLGGVVTYVLRILTVVVLVWVVMRAWRRGALGAKYVQNLAIRLPAIGGALRTVGEAQVAWMLQLLLNVQLDIRRVIPLALQSTGNEFYMQHTDQIVSDVGGGDSIYAAFAHSGAFREDFLRQLEVGEESGRLVEALGPMAQQYEQRARTAFHVLNMVAGFAVWGMVALFIIYFIFRGAMFYFNSINDLLDF